MFLITVNKNILSVQQREPLTAGSRGIYTCRFTFDKSWEGLGRRALFRAGSLCRAVYLEDCQCTVPWELLVPEHTGLELEVSVYGGGEEEILPTVWDSLGTLRPGAEPGELTRPPTPDEYQQAVASIRSWAEQARAGARRAEELSRQAPCISQRTGNWLVYDPYKGCYTDTGVSAGGYVGDEAPWIGSDGCWWLGSRSTGVSASGRDGATPVKGTDYWTAEDRAAMVSDVLAALPAAEEVSV